MQREPAVDADGATTCTFLVHGLRFAAAIAPRMADLDALARGGPLALQPDTTNPVNRDAILIVTPDGAPIGWVPELLVDYVNVVRRIAYQVRVARVNGPRVPAHLRVLVRLDGHVPASYRPFVGTEWEPVT